MVKTLCSTFKGAQVLSLVGELRTHEPCDKKKKKREREGGGANRLETADGLCRVKKSLCGVWMCVCCMCTHVCARWLGHGSRCAYGHAGVCGGVSVCVWV